MKEQAVAMVGARCTPSELLEFWRSDWVKLLDPDDQVRVRDGRRQDAWVPIALIDAVVLNQHGGNMSLLPPGQSREWVGLWYEVQGTCRIGSGSNGIVFALEFLLERWRSQQPEFPVVVICTVNPEELRSFLGIVGQVLEVKR